MKNTSESVWTFQIIIIFILIFSAFLTLALSYSKVYVIKNRAIGFIEKFEGATTESIDYINTYAGQKSYVNTGVCVNTNNDEENWYGISFDETPELAIEGKEYNYCVRERIIESYLEDKNSDSNPNRTRKKLIYYELKFFYNFNLPFLGEIGKYTVKGETKNFIGNSNRITLGE